MQLPITMKSTLWNKLAVEWKLNNLDEICTEIGFDDLESSLNQVLIGGANGRFVLDLNS